MLIYDSYWQLTWWELQFHLDLRLKVIEDRFSWGFGGTATKSHAGNFEKFGQTFGKDSAMGQPSENVGESWDISW